MNSCKFLSALSALLTSISLVACGGGGGGGGGTPQTQIPPASAATALSASNYSAVATPTAAALAASSTVNDTFESINSASAPANAQQPALALLSANPMQLSLLSLNYFSAREQSQAVRSTSQNCPGGGSLSGTANDADNSNNASAGDTLTLIANNCILATGQPAANGSMSISINALTKNTAGVISNLNIRVSFASFSIDGSAYNGEATVSGVPNGAASIVYDNFSIVRRGVNAIYNYTSSSNAAGQVTISGLITVNNSTYTLATVSPIVYGVYRPQSGTLRISDAANNKIELSPNAAGTGSVDIRLYLAGATVPSSAVNVPWSAI